MISNRFGKRFFSKYHTHIILLVRILAKELDGSNISFLFYDINEASGPPVPMQKFREPFQSDN